MIKIDDASMKPPRQKPARLLVVRFSSFGDIVQGLGIPAVFRHRFPDGEVDWLVREDFKMLLADHPLISRVIPFSRREGFFGLIRRAWGLAGEGYTHVYDAHSNVRSWLVVAVFASRAVLAPHLAPGHSRFPHFARRTKDRVRRWLFFRFKVFRKRYPVLPVPFRGAESFLRPLTAWGLDTRVPPAPQFYTSAKVPSEILTELQALRRPLIALAPSAAWEMKRWPIEHWKNLIKSLPEFAFALLGGPDDRFLDELKRESPERVVNLAGRLSLAESSQLLAEASLVIANDTGILHVADQLGRPTLALIGPTAFGYPSQPSSEALEIDLECKPCSKDGRGRCRNSLYQRCLVELKPDVVARAARRILNEN